MSLNKLLSIDEKEKARLWEMFLHEKILDDNEQMLLADLHYYEERIRRIGSVDSPVEASLLKNYMEHIKNTRALLFSLQHDRQKTLQPQLGDLSAE